MLFTCRICKQSGEMKTYRVREMFFGTREEFDYVQCPSCRCLQIRDVPATTSKYYPTGYFSFTPIDETSPLASMKGILRKQRNRSLLFDRGIVGRVITRLRPSEFPFEILKRVGPLAEMSILDVGCGSGNLPYHLKEAGVDNVLGIDPFIEHDIEYRNGLKVLKRTIIGMQDDPRRFDLIMFNHSFEHMPDPEEVMKAAAAILKNRGTVLIRIPTVDSYAWEHYREHWVQLDAPRHLYLHSRTSLETLASRAGFSVAEIVYDSTAFQFWGSEQYIRDIPLESPNSYKHGLAASVFAKERMREFQRRAVELNREERGDMAAFFLKK